MTENPDLQLVASTYPMFGNNIKRTWGSAEFVTYIKELLVAAKGSGGNGLPEPVTQALQRLSDLHDQNFHDLLPHMDNNENFKSVNQEFPIIGGKLEAYWGRKEFGPFMSELLHDNRGGNRKGFPFETLMALHALAEQHNQEYRHLFPAVDIWSQGQN